MNVIVVDPDTGDRIEYRNFTELRVKAAMGKICREFTLTATTRGADQIPFYVGQQLEVVDGDDKLFTGFIERMSTATGQKGNVFTISGRDKLADLVDSNLPKMYDLKPPLAAICEYVIGFLGIDSKVIDETGEARIRLGYVASPDQGDTAGEFLAEVARRKRSLIQSTGEGDLLITRGIGTEVENELINRTDAKGNNLLGADFIIDHSRRFGRVSSIYQVALASSDSKSNDPRRLVSREFQVSDDRIRQTRFKVVANDMNTLAEDASLRATWELGLQRAEAFCYTASVNGFRDWQGRLWALNTAPRVDDQYNGIETRMLISEIEYILAPDGPVTKMKLTDRDAFQAELKIQKEFVNDGPPES